MSKKNRKGACERCGRRSGVVSSKYISDYRQLGLPFLCNECLIADTNREVARKIAQGKMVSSR